MQTVVRHAEQHGLHRDVEVSELLQPLADMYRKRGTMASMSMFVPYLIGFGVTALTGVGAPLLIGYVAGMTLMTKNMPTEAEKNNIQQVGELGTRMADADKTSLLDDMDHMEYNND